MKPHVSILLLAPLAVFAFSSCQKPADSGETSPAGVVREVFGKMPDGREVALFTLTNAKGLRARVTEYGAILVSMEAPDRDGKLADVTHGYDTLDGWLTNTSYFGAMNCCGRNSQGFPNDHSRQGRRRRSKWIIDIIL